jgi:hypothetical protein
MNVIYVPGMPTCFNNPAEDMCVYAHNSNMCVYAYNSNIYAQCAGKQKICVCMHTTAISLHNGQENRGYVCVCTQQQYLCTMGRKTEDMCVYAYNSNIFAQWAGKIK